jgi:glycosyltransferase involved in cell wall biosynthesis
MKILYVTHNWFTHTHTDSHHFSKITGYGRLVFYMAAVHDVTVLTWGETNREYCEDKIKYKIIEIKNRRYVPFARRNKLSEYASEISSQYDIVHSLYTDTANRLVGHDNLVVTLHILPKVAIYKQFKHKLFMYAKYHMIQKKVLAACKNIIAVSSNLVPTTNNSTYTMIPHGVDINYWKSIDSCEYNLISKSKMKMYSNIILCVGYHSLNSDDLYNIVSLMPSTLFLIVGKKEQISHSNVQLFNNISDDELKFLYHIADLFFRPIDFATANNSILESMAMKLPIVTKNINGISDYLDSDTAFLANSSIEYYSIISDALRNPEITSKKANNAYKKLLLNYSWDKIAVSVEKIYESIK